ncbi:hypothetical protein [Paraburkholderia terrae]|uniref:PLD phosphodiesterase domain-containing protein n=1 Tax=Paraburkholderia terrae TaxID=311230 RepID=A0A2I8EZN9_9BURK|nr:hypothetical protein [Paraburkholderia terrae]AUT64959.1 hypothetical protein C2L65_35750 [Paraburkholderia terrae]
MKQRTPLYQHVKGKDFHTALASTYGIDFEAWENVALPRLQSTGCRNVLLLTDAGMMTHAMNGASTLPRKGGRSYTVNAISAPRVFHPKLTLLVGRASARLIVASANITAPGLAGNLEIAGIIDATPDLPSETSLVASALRFLRSRLEGQGSVVEHQLGRMDRQAGWLADADPADDLVLMQDGSAAQFLGSDRERGIGARFVQNVGPERVKRLIVLSPYWDSDLSALQSLIDALNPQQTVLLVDVRRKLFPTHGLTHRSGIGVVDIGTAARSSFVHAKLIIAETDDADHVLYGSTNCTTAALGTGTFRGLNDEASLYRRLSPATIAEQLEIGALVDSRPVPFDELPPQLLTENLKFDSLRAGQPGAFEVRDEILYWHTGNRVIAERVNVELFQLDNAPLSTTLVPLPSPASDVRRFRIEGDAPAFARLLFPDGTRSALACVTIANDIYALARESKGTSAEKAIERLTGSSRVDVYLLEAIQALALAESDAAVEHADSVADGKRTQDESEPDVAPETYQILSYQDFVRDARAHRVRGGEAPSQFADSGLWHVEQLLNRSIGMASHRTVKIEAEPDAAELQRLFRRGDETADPERKLNANGKSRTAVETGVADDVDDPMKEAELRQRFTSDRLSAIEAHHKYLWDLRKRKQVSATDVLRLRAILMLIATAASGKTPTDMLSEHDLNPRSRLILPVAGEQGWPRLMLNQLGAFFGTKNAPIEFLEIKTQESSLPSDILECWATCVWALHASHSAVDRYEERDDMRKLGSRFRILPQQVYHMLGMSIEQFAAEAFTRTYDCLVRHFALPMDIDPAEMQSRHERFLAGASHAQNQTSIT